MVYRGKPSPACAPCRSRKIRCDLQRPRCSQCRRAKETCTGYRDINDVMFHDETKSTRSRALTRTHRHLAESHASNSATPFPLILPNIDERVKCYFIHNYVLVQEGTAGYLSGISRLLVRPSLSKALEAALIAVGSAGMACKESSPYLEMRARQNYGTAIAYINEALQTTAKTKETGTLAAILVLGLYEMIMCDSQQSIKSWYNHILGALAVAHLRGAQQFKDSEVEMELFLHLRSQILLSCLQRNEDVPNSLKRLTDEAHNYGSSISSGPRQLSAVIMKLCSLRARIQFNQGAEWETVFAECVHVKKDLGSTYHSILRSQGPYSTWFVEEATTEVYLNKFHTYRSLWSAWIWNLYHVAKIILHETVVDLLQLQIDNVNALPSALAVNVVAQYHESLSELYGASSEILASVPYHLNFHQQSEHPAKPVHGLILMWNLYAAARLKIRAGSAREWSIRRLQFIGHSMGIRQATALANALEKRAVWEAMEEREISDCENLNARTPGRPQIPMQRYLTGLPREPFHERFTTVL